ncbi:putative O-linked N-acetylglucosamine transferase, SPINDLY family [Polaromonas sp. CF318]|uniref:tetratricopeptide repeat protein n=1 Tax=Polaromonas sp. CF318 TaxID=1144318 RepID=UPI0002714C87|nr:tetratricopeptide repeat protein [Polaromonas sp. CF318]EJL82731.1 putative O-linked N-acetylglucosamine transferase, SPINDLY family [Polaromonas sp. CF318]
MGRFDQAMGAGQEAPGNGLSAAQLLEQGMALEQQGQLEEALRCYDTAISLMPELARAHFNRGTILLDRGDAQQALEAFTQAVRYKPESAGAHFNLGAAHTRLEQHEAAVSAYRQALALKPDFPEAEMALGTALEELGQDQAAVASYRRALEMKHDHVESHEKLVKLLGRLGRSNELAAVYRRVLELDPDNVEILYNLGLILRHLGRMQDAAMNFRRAVELRPGFIDALCNLGDVSIGLRLFDDAVASYRKVLELEPENAGVHHNLAAALKDIGRLDEALESYHRALAIKPDFPIAQSNVLLIQHLLSRLSVEQQLEEARRFGTMVARLAPAPAAPGNLADPFRCLRIGFVSGDLHSHPVGHFIESVLAALSAGAAGRLELFAYSNSLTADEVTARIKRHFQSWQSVVGLADEVMAQRIRDDGIDILIDLSGHTGKNRLPVFAWKPAPVQISWLGYFATTGVEAIDYLIADPWTLPSELESHFTEEILRLPETRLCFTPPAHDVEIAPLPALRNGYVTFACFNTLSKVNDSVVALWARVLHAVPGSRLQLVAPPDQQVHWQRVVTERFAAHGIIVEQLQLLSAGPRAAYLATYQQVDIALDPFPYTGGTTTAEALWMGVPVLTLAGKSFLARQGVGLLMNAGLPEWVAEDADDYVRRAVSHAGDLQRLASLRAGMREQVLASPLFDAPQFARHFEEALRNVWRKWCEAQTASKARAGN